MEIMSTLRRYDRLTVVCNTSLHFFPAAFLSSGSHVKLTGGGLLKNVTLSFARPLLFFVGRALSSSSFFARSIDARAAELQEAYFFCRDSTHTHFHAFFFWGGGRRGRKNAKNASFSQTFPLFRDEERRTNGSRDELLPLSL